MKKISLEKILDFFLVFMLILNCQSVYQNSIGKNYYIFELTFGIIILATAYKLWKYGVRQRDLLPALFISVIYFLYILIFILISVEKEFFVSFAARYLIFPFVIMYFAANRSMQNKKVIFRYFIIIVSAICLMSLIFWTTGVFLRVLPPTGKFSFKWGSIYEVNSFYDLHFEIQWVDWLHNDMKRNTSIFTEGPMFALVIMLAQLFMYLFPEQIKHRKIVMGILIVTSFTTFSITSYIFTFVVCFVMLYNNRKIRYIMIATVVPLALAALIYVYRMKTSTGSYELRSGDMQITYDAWIKAPVFGHGFGHINDIVLTVTDRGWGGISSSITAILIQGGLFYLFMFIVPIAICLKNAVKKKNFRIFFTAASYMLMLIVVLFNTFYINFFIWILLSCTDFYKDKDETERLRDAVMNMISKKHRY